MLDETTPWTGWVPASTPETAPFWTAANEGVFLLQKCPDCGQFQYHYRAHCSHCWSSDIQDYPSSGRGTVWTFSVVYRNSSPGYDERVPYVVAVVELEGGMKVVSNIVGGDPESVTIGTEVEVVFATTSGGQQIPLFRVVAG